MAYDRYDRDERSRWSEDRSDRSWRGNERSQRDHQDRGGREDRGFFERMGDEVRSWFGDEDEGDRQRYGGHRERGYGDRQLQRSSRGFNEDRGRHREYDRERSESRERDFDRGRSGGGYRPMTGDYGRGTDHESEQFFAASGIGRGERGLGGYDREQDRGRGQHRDRSFGEFHRESDSSEGPWSRDEYRRTSFAGSAKSDRDFDPHYRDWRERHLGDIDRDYDDYRRERQSRFENDFGSWREQRQQKRGLLGQVREHMEVVGKDDEHLGSVDRVAGDRIILTKSDPESGGAHHSLPCTLIDRVEGGRVILDRSADEARHQWRDESRSRALFEREDQGQMGPGVLDRSFSGTYRR